MAKNMASTMAIDVCYEAVQIHGGMGYMRECAIERMVRDCRLHAIGGGATEVMLDQVAKAWDA